MEFGYLSTPPALAHLVKAAWFARGSRSEFDHAEPIVSDGCVELIFNLADPFEQIDQMGRRQRQPADLLVGPTIQSTIAVPTGEVDLIGLRLWPGRTSAFLGCSMSSLTDRMIAITDVMARADRLLEELRDQPVEVRLDRLATSLTSRARAAEPTVSDALTASLAVIERHRGNVSIAKLAKSAGVSRRHLERQFRDEVGLSAKQFARIVRIQHVLSSMNANPSLSGADIAARCGYSDQAHLIRECRELTGTTPHRLTTTESTPSLSILMRS